MHRGTWIRYQHHTSIGPKSLGQAILSKNAIGNTVKRANSFKYAPHSNIEAHERTKVCWNLQAFESCTENGPDYQERPKVFIDMMRGLTGIVGTLQKPRWASRIASMFIPAWLEPRVAEGNQNFHSTSDKVWKCQLSLWLDERNGWTKGEEEASSFAHFSDGSQLQPKESR